MKTLQAAAVSFSLLGVALTGVALLIGLRAMGDGAVLGGAAVVSFGFAILAGFCLLSGVILTAEQPFVPRSSTQL